MLTFKIANKLNVSTEIVFSSNHFKELLPSLEFIDNIINLPF